MDFILDNLGVIIYATLLFTPPLLFAALGSCFSEVSGVINIGIEGMMVAGAFAGCAVAHFTGSPWIGFFSAGVAGALFGYLHAIASVKLGADQTISGTAINMLAPGVAVMICRTIFGSTDTIPLALAAKIPMVFTDTFDCHFCSSNFVVVAVTNNLKILCFQLFFRFCVCKNKCIFKNESK